MSEVWEGCTWQSLTGNTKQATCGACRVVGRRSRQRGTRCKVAWRGFGDTVSLSQGVLPAGERDDSRNRYTEGGGRREGRIPAGWILSRKVPWSQSYGSEYGMFHVAGSIIF